MVVRALTVCSLLILLPAGATADEFDRLDGRAIAAAIEAGRGSLRESVPFAELGALPWVLKGTRAPLILCETDQGNPGGLLISPALRASPPSDDQPDRKPVPILLLERFGTFDGGNTRTRLAQGRDQVLFGGFQIDLDTGQIVPEGQGGDIRFEADGPDGWRLVTVGKARLMVPETSPVTTPSVQPVRTLGRLVAPPDFAGDYRLAADGQWSGKLELKLVGEGQLGGVFRSDLNGTAYPVSGQIDPEQPARAVLAISFPRSRLELQGYLWSAGKGAIAGTASLLDRSFGFFAVREGASADPEDAATLSPPPAGSPRGQILVALSASGLELDGHSLQPTKLTEVLLKRLEGDAHGWIALRVADDTPYRMVREAVAAIRAAGAPTIRVLP